MWDPQSLKKPVAVLFLSVLVISVGFSCRQDSPSDGMRADNASDPATTPAASTAETKPLDGFTFPPASLTRTIDDQNRMNVACISCHTLDGHVDNPTMHDTKAAGAIACVDCHGGNWKVRPSVVGLHRTDARYVQTRIAAHGQKPPKDRELWTSSANPKAPGAATLQESPDYIRFVNPGDLRAAVAACGACHNVKREHYVVDTVSRSMMSHGAMLWQAALYNNGAINRKNAVYGESYTVQGEPRAIFPTRYSTIEASAEPDLSAKNERAPVTNAQVRLQGILPGLFPLPRWEVSQPGNILRVFERGGKLRPIVGIPNREDEPGRPDVKLSVRGLGTDVRTDPVFIGLQKTRLLDPTLNLFGTNDHPGDYRGSGCTACHVVYANDRDPVHSGPWAKFGNRGQSFSSDATVNPPPLGGPSTRPTTMPSTQSTIYPWDVQTTVKSGESGHPIRHAFVKNAPTQTCIVCHMHPGTNVVNSYLGYQWWDNETDGEFMYPKLQKRPTPQDMAKVSGSNPEGTAARGLWSNLYPNDASRAGNAPVGPDFLENTYRLNPLLKNTQFADFHGHGWVYRKVFSQGRDGSLLDLNRKPIPFNAPDRFEQAVHLKDIHLERGMQCVDCHFKPDAHGDGNLYGETRNAVLVQCVDCHGSATALAKMIPYVRVTKMSADKKRVSTRDQKLAEVAKRNAFSGNAATVLFDSSDEDDAKARIGKIIDSHFEFGKLAKDDKDQLIQKSSVYESARTRMLAENVGTLEIQAELKKAGLVEKWVVPQVIDTLKKGYAPSEFATRTDAAAAKQKEERAKRALYAHTVRKGFDSDGNSLWGGDPSRDQQDPKGNRILRMELAHPDSEMSCYACHSSWNTSCFGCHLPMKANQFKPMLHNEGQTTRNFTNYNFQTLRDDIYMLGVDSTVKQHKVVPVRSACAVIVSSQDANRQWIYTQQQTVSAKGYAGSAFSPYFPHTVRATETKQCNDCHVDKAKNDNNAIMAQLLMQGTNAVNFVGRFAWVAQKDAGVAAIAVTERDEPQAVIGSRLHDLAYPEDYLHHITERKMELTEAHEHHGTALDVQLRGEYLYAACGPDGFIAYDVANIDNKGFSERIITAPVSPLGQRFYVKSSYATSVCTPSTLAIDPTRPRLPENDEGVVTQLGDPKSPLGDPRKIHDIYAFLYLTDRDEGLIVIGNPLSGPSPGISTLLDGNPNNNFLQRAIPAFNPKGLLRGARHMAFYGTKAYVCCDAGVVILDMNNPLDPKMVPSRFPGIRQPRKIAFQFRYGFVCDADGLKIFDMTFPESPVLKKTLPLSDARDIYISRTYGYVAGGKEGVVIVDLTNPEDPRVVQKFSANGAINDTYTVRVGMTNSSLYAYVADGVNGLKVLQLTSADDTPGFMGFSPRPSPRLIAWRKTDGPAVAISEGLDRDRAVDEDGNQLSVFGRRGARPFTREEMQKLFLRSDFKDAQGRPAVYRVTNDPVNDPLPAP